MSPGFTPRPSLSGDQAVAGHRDESRVSPGFTPRPSLSVLPGARRRRVAYRVSPGFTPRPSLSADGARGRAAGGGRVSPGFTPRPSLSDCGRETRSLFDTSVAGVHAPAFVERTSAIAMTWAGNCVAGVHAPAFVERASGSRRSSLPCRVSPGFTPRPSLSASTRASNLPGHVTCRRGSRPGLR